MAEGESFAEAFAARDNGPSRRAMGGGATHDVGDDGQPARRLAEKVCHDMWQAADRIERHDDEAGILRIPSAAQSSYSDEI